MGKSGYCFLNGAKAIKQQFAGIPVHDDKGYIHNNMPTVRLIYEGNITSRVIVK
jgi:hypothetical protein